MLLMPFLRLCAFVWRCYIEILSWTFTHNQNTYFSTKQDSTDAFADGIGLLERLENYAIVHFPQVYFVVRRILQVFPVAARLPTGK